MLFYNKLNKKESFNLQPTYIIISELEYFDKDWEITVFPQPKAPGIAVVPPCTQLNFAY